MITYIDSKNASQYKILFEKAEKALKDYFGITATISTQERYFHYLPQLMELPINEDSINNPYLLGEGNRYTILPLDEEHFEIDANSRMIKIPDAFKKNGIAV